MYNSSQQQLQLEYPQTFDSSEDTNTTDNTIATDPAPDTINSSYLKQRAQWIMKIRDGYKAVLKTYYQVYQLCAPQ